MGTRFTVAQPVYRDRLLRAGAAEVLPLAATRTEHTIAHLRHTSEAGRREIVEEVGDTVRRADVVVLACTLFPLVGPLLLDINPACLLLDPADGISGTLKRDVADGHEPADARVTGGTLPLEDVRQRAGGLFPGWDIDSIEEYEVPDAAERHSALILPVPVRRDILLASFQSRAESAGAGGRAVARKPESRALSPGLAS